MKRIVKSTEELEVLPFGSVIAEAGKEDIFCLWPEGWESVGTAGAEPSSEISGVEYEVLRLGLYNQ